jgi:hypothetical protein
MPKLFLDFSVSSTFGEAEDEFVAQAARAIDDCYQCLELFRSKDPMSIERLIQVSLSPTTLCLKS